MPRKPIVTKWRKQLLEEAGDLLDDILATYIDETLTEEVATRISDLFYIHLDRALEDTPISQ